MDKKTILWICFIGLVIRVIYTVVFSPDIHFQDEEKFWSEGVSLATGKGLQTGEKFAHDAPVTGLLIGFIAWVTGHSVLWTKLIFAAVSAASIYLIAALAYEIYPEKGVSLIAAVVSCWYPFFIFYSSMVQSETIFVCIVTLLFLQLLRNNKNDVWKTGVTAGVAHLTRPTILFFLPVLWVWQKLVQKCSTRLLVLAMFLFCITVLPWGVRNAITLDQFSINTSGSGQALWEGNNPWNDFGGVSREFSDPKAYLAELPQGLGEFEQDQWKKQKAIAFIKDNPERFIVLSIKKFVRFWNVWPNSPDFQQWYYKAASLFSFGLVLVLSMFAVYSFRGQFQRLSVVYLFVAYYTAIHMVTIGSIRYRLPLEPLLIALASAFLWKVYQSKQSE